MKSDKASAAAPGRRTSARIALRGAAVVELPGGVTRTVQSWDMSIDGLSVMTPKPIAPGTRCTIRFDIPLGEQSRQVKTAVKSVYSSYTGADGFRVGFIFTALDAETERLIVDFLR